jgi:hypothetical protein
MYNHQIINITLTILETWQMAGQDVRYKYDKKYM